MGREILVTWAGRRDREEWDRLCERYRKRIRKQIPLRDMPVRAHPKADGPRRLRAEGESLLASLPDPCWTVALDRRGQMRSSSEMAGWLGRLLEDWPHPVAFLIGSDLGLDEAVRREARERLSFGPLTLPHELTRVILYEQIYRSLAIAAGIKYHRGAL